MPSFSFFENESTELSNLTKQLGANITMKDTAAASTTTEKINRASQYLESSLIDFPNPPSKIDQLSSDLEASETKLKMMQHNYQKIQEASRNALDELTRAKEEFAKEVALRQQHELTIAQLRHQLVIYFQAKKYARDHLAVLTKEEIERVSKVRAGLDKTCCDLKSYRDNLLKEIDSLLPKPVEREEIVSLEVSSLVSERDQLRQDIRSLETIRDDVLNEMIMLNSKNAQLTEINNDLSRRMSEREKDFSPSPSLSSENISMQRKSSEASIARKTAASPEPKTGFKLKRTMFSKLSGKNKEASPVYGQLGNSSHLSLHPYEKTKRKPSQENQAHSFQPTSFLRPTKCDGCGETLWGLSELRCAHCLCASHARCLPQIATHCYMMSMSSIDLGPSEMDLSAVLFGLDLCTRAQLEQRPVPLIIVRCIEAVEKRGMSYEGIYRKSGGATQMKMIQTSFESGSEPIDLEDYELINDICSVTSILKQYFRELPNPLLTYQFYSKFIDAVSMNHEQERIDKFYELLSQLPKVNYDTLELLMKHLHSVQEHSSENLMTTKNLAMVFGPTLMRDEDGSRELTDMSYKNAVIEFLITRVHQLFT
ncbi:hypothetical protein G6F37_011638 [Rhizopus arrhizus]|nr:hypothetical protein G6F38_011703 [Rhizopus arrhizus]KAG1148266.1 hypothetical protein G6F37_011638 [Rhizopus arrhizus]